MDTFHQILYNPVTIQLIGFVALSFGVLVFQVNKRSSMLQLQLLASLLWTVQYFLLGALSGSVMNGLGALRNLAFELDSSKKRSLILPTAFITIFSVAEILTWQSWLGLLPFISTVTGTLAFWQLNPRTIRLITLTSPPLWFIYNIIVRSYAGVAIEVILFAANIIAIYRFDILKAPESKLNRTA